MTKKNNVYKCIDFKLPSITCPVAFSSNLTSWSDPTTLKFLTRNCFLGLLQIASEQQHVVARPVLIGLTTEALLQHFKKVWEKCNLHLLSFVYYATVFFTWRVVYGLCRHTADVVIITVQNQWSVIFKTILVCLGHHHRINHTCNFWKVDSTITVKMWWAITWCTTKSLGWSKDRAKFLPLMGVFSYAYQCFWSVGFKCNSISFSIFQHKALNKCLY